MNALQPTQSISLANMMLLCCYLRSQAIVIRFLGVGLLFKPFFLGN